MLLALGALWGVYDWFSALPDTPTDTPWALLGTGGDSEILARRMRGLRRTVPGVDNPESERPLGQMQYGPAGLIADLEAKAREDEVTWSYEPMDPWHIAFTPGVRPLQVKVGGEVVFADGRPTRVDPLEVRAKAAEQAARLHARL